jgi:hypothetical protein
VGLDNYAARSPEGGLTEQDEAAFEDAGIELCGGAYSGGRGSFRGKVYAEFVLELTGESLYDEWLAPETVARMADDFDRCNPETAVADLGLDIDTPTPYEVVELRRFFDVCRERGLGVVGWA